jgi:hypothetical protein
VSVNYSSAPSSPSPRESQHFLKSDTDSKVEPNRDSTGQSDTSARVSSYVKDFPLPSLPPIIEQNLKKRIFHLRAPFQLHLFKDSPFAKAAETMEYAAKYTTCGWVAAYVAHHLCELLNADPSLPKEKIQSIIEQLGPDKFIRDSTRFVGDLTAFGGSDDKVEGLVLGQDIFNILMGKKTPSLEHVFIIEGAAEEPELKANGDTLEVFNLTHSFRANYKKPEEFYPIKDAIDDIVSGKRPFVIVVSFETFPLGEHFVTYAFRRNSEGSLECLLFEGLNEPHSEWVLGEDPTAPKKHLRSTTEWLFDELEIKTISGLGRKAKGGVQ